MPTIKISKVNKNIRLQNVSRNIKVQTKNPTIKIESAGGQGQPGVGVPAGGTTNQILAKISGNDYAAHWIDIPVTSVNGNTGDVVLDAIDVGADPTGSAAQALQDANDYTDTAINGVDTGVLSVVAGTNVTVDNTDPKNPVVSSTGGISSVEWGDITGTLSSQTDLQNALNAKENTFSKGSLIAGSNVSLTGTLTNRLVGAGDITVNALVESVEWGNIDGDISDQADLQAALSAKANDSDVVKLTGNQTISDNKIFTTSTTNAPIVTIQGPTNVPLSIIDTRDSNSTAGGGISGSTTNNNAAMQSGDRIFYFVAGGNDGTVNRNGGALNFYAADIWSSNNYPTYATIDTAKSNARIENIRFGGTGTAGVTINETGADQDFRVEGDTDTNLLFTDASTDRVGIGTNTPSEKLSVNGNISVTGTVDGRDVSVDGTKLDGIQAGAEVNVNADWNSSSGDSQILNKPTIPGSIEDLSGDSDDINEGVTNLFLTSSERSKLSNIEAGADVTDATNVAAAGAVMESDTSTASMSFVVDEDDMASNSATKVPTQQSTKAYVDNKLNELSDSPLLILDEMTIPITHSDLVATGMDWWPDGTIGFLDGGSGNRISFTSNGANIATVAHNPTTGGVAAVINPYGVVQDPLDTLDYSSGGPVFAPNAYGLSTDPGLVMMLHCEKHDDPHFWSGVGMAKINLIDQQWYDLGLVVTPEYSFTGTLSNSIDVGSGNFAFDDDWYYVFFKDSPDGTNVTNLSVARAPLQDVIDAAVDNGAVPVFTKYSGGSWSSAGVGGACADDLLPDLEGYLIWQDVIQVEGYGGWALVYTRDTWADVTPVDTVEVRWSKDLVHWSEPQTLVEPDTNNERFYITAAPPLDNEPIRPKVIGETDPLDIYVVKSDISSTPAERWDTAEVERYRFNVKSSAEMLLGAVQKTDTSTADMSFVVDEDDMSSNSATKVPTQQSVKAYVDANIGGGGSMDDFVVDADTGTPQTIADGQTLSILGGTGIDTSAANTGDITVGLDSATIASLALADSSLQSGDNITELTNNAGFTTNTGDVVGPASSTNNRIALFDSTTGKLLKDSGQWTVSSYTLAAPATSAINIGSIAILAALSTYGYLNLFHTAGTGTGAHIRFNTNWRFGQLRQDPDIGIRNNAENVKYFWVDSTNQDTHTLNDLIVGDTLRVGTEYAFPTTDGNAGEVLTTDGSGAVSWASASSTNGFELKDTDMDSNYAYVGYERIDDSWFIYRRDRSTNVRQYAEGSSGYVTNWDDREILVYA